MDDYGINACGNNPIYTMTDDGKCVVTYPSFRAEWLFCGAGAKTAPPPPPTRMQRLSEWWFVARCRFAEKVLRVPICWED